MILRHEKLKYGSDSKQIYGILFDGAWLWEEYLARLLTKCAFNHPRNKESTGGIRMFEKAYAESSIENNGRRMYPDFYRAEDFSGRGGFIIDAKYKHLQNEAGREDLYQLVSYMHVMEILNGGLLYPLSSDNEKIFKNSYKLAGMGGIISVFGFPISIKSTYTDFIKCMKVVESDIIAILAV